MCHPCCIDVESEARRLSNSLAAVELGVTLRAPLWNAVGCWLAGVGCHSHTYGGMETGTLLQQSTHVTYFRVLKSNWILIRQRQCSQWGVGVCFIEITLQNFIEILIIKVWLLRVKVLLTESSLVSLIQIFIFKTWRQRPHSGCFLALLSVTVWSFVWFYSKGFFNL